MNKNFKEKSKSLPRPHTAKASTKPLQNIDQTPYLFEIGEKNENFEQNPQIAKTLYAKPPMFDFFLILFEK